MSFISRQRVRQRMNSRITAPSSSEQFMPSIEESLQNWLTRDSSSLTPLLDSCRCCNKINCENLQALVYAIKKLEEDARLAAGKLINRTICIYCFLLIYIRNWAESIA